MTHNEDHGPADYITGCYYQGTELNNKYYPRAQLLPLAALIARPGMDTNHREGSVDD